MLIQQPECVLVALHEGHLSRSNLPVSSLNMVHRLRPTLSRTQQATVLVQNHKLPGMGEQSVHRLADTCCWKCAEDHGVGVQAVAAELHDLDNRVRGHDSVDHTESLEENSQLFFLFSCHGGPSRQLPGLQTTNGCQDIISSLLRKKTFTMLPVT